ncbi:MAG: hypothetical protein LQ340_006703 [Diploschistes diacapsis]|nr:MAG: hypothetical protein LQ340_006703 [Diploschistes diacapsis]
MSFVITRSDLFAPRKEQVDAMMPTLVRMLRNALGPQGNRFRLGNVYCVSSQRGWWTKKLKADIWSRGSGGWMLGKVNVGKSSLFEAIFPKGRSKKVKSRLSSGQDGQDSEPEAQSKGLSDDHLHWLQSDPNLGATSGVGHLLPPAPQDEQYPTMPTVSNLPGTTVSPIRLPFGSGKGELIDLPGLARNNLNDMVYEESQASLFMQHRISARQYSIKRGQSLVVSNLIRITPNSEDLVFLACPFVPLDCHVTNTEKAVAILAQENHTAVKGIAKPGVQNIIASAGIFELRWDVTKIRTGPLTSHLDVKIPIQALPFVVYSLDLLIESVGWIELAVQVRKRNIEDQGAGFNRYPSVEVFSPSGKSVGVRPPLNTWVLGGHRRKPVSKRTKRPRQSKKGEKKRLKIEQRLLGRGG